MRSEGRGRERQLGLVVGVGVGRDHLVERHVRFGLGLGHAGARLGVLCGRVGRQVPEVSGLGDLAGDRRLGGGLFGLRVVGLATAAEEAARAAARRLGLVDLVVARHRSSSSLVVATERETEGVERLVAGTLGRRTRTRAVGGHVAARSAVARGTRGAGAERGEQVVDGLLGLRLLVGSAVVATGCRGEGRERRTTVRRGLGLGADGLRHGRVGPAAHLDEREVVGVHRRVGNAPRPGSRAIRGRRAGRRMPRPAPSARARGSDRRAGRGRDRPCRRRTRRTDRRRVPARGARRARAARGCGSQPARGLGHGREDRGRRVGGRRGAGPCGSGRRVVRERTPRVGGDLGARRGARAALVPSGGCRGRGDRMPRRLDRGSGGRGRRGGRLARLDRRGRAAVRRAPRPARRSARA